MTSPRIDQHDLLLSTAVHALPLHLFIVDSAGVVLCMLPTTSSIFSADPTGTLLVDHFPPLREGLARASRGDHVAETVAVAGKLYDVHVCPAKGGGGAVGALVDVTERERMRRDLVATERLAALGTLAGGVAHELNNPLTYLSLNLSSARRAFSDLAEAPPAERDALLRRADRALEIVEEGVARVTTSVRDLSLFARTPSHEREPLDVREAMDAAISITWNELRHRARLRKVYGEVPRVEANAGELRQVFAHLLLNAAAAIPEGGEAREIAVVIDLTPEGRVGITVSDTGRGIPAELIERVFEPFFRLDDEGGKRGLGLGMCRGIVQGLSGTITIESPRPDGARGTEVRVSLPVHDPSSRIPSSSTMRAARGVATARALLIDDEPLIGEAVRRALTPEIEVVLAASGRQAIDLILSDQAFDAIVCDLMMPDIGGMDVYEAIRRARPGLVERFIFITGGAFTPKAARFLSQLAAPVIEKPLAIEALRECILSRAALRRSR